MKKIKINFSNNNKKILHTLIFLLALIALSGRIYETISATNKKNKLELILFNTQKNPKLTHRIQHPFLSHTERSSANKIIKLLNQPWNELFKAFDAENNNKIKLLSLASNSKTGLITIQAECENTDEAATYIKKLNSEKNISGATLTHQENIKTDSKQAIRIVVEASWKIN